MALFELYPIVVACFLWGSQWLKKRILFHCDNMATVQIINKGRSKVKIINKLMRKLTWLAAQYSFTVHTEHVPGKLNNIADAISRFQIKKIPKFGSASRPITNSLPTIQGFNNILKAEKEDLWNYALSPATLRTYEAAYNLYIKFLVLCNLYVHLKGSIPPISEDIIIKFVIYCSDVMHLKWCTIKLYLAGIHFHFIKAGIGKPLDQCFRLSYILKAVRR